MEIEEEISSNYPWIVNQARRYCSNEDDARDLAGDTILKVLSNIDKYDRDKPIRVWIAVIMRNIYITYYNRSLLASFSSVVDDPISEGETSDMAELKETFSMIRRCARESRYVECVIYYAKGYSYVEISTILGIPIGTVMSRIHLGRKKIGENVTKS